MNISAFPAILLAFLCSTTASAQTTPSTSFCFGDGTAAPCPCSNNGAVGRGCATPEFPNGALLSNGGVSSISADTMTLTASDITGPALFFQSDGVALHPISFGHGLLCASVGLRRLGVSFPSANVAVYPSLFSPEPIHVAGSPFTIGDTKHYQCWYRDIGTQCFPLSNSGMTQGISVTWVP